MRLIEPLGPHAHVYARHGCVVHVLDEVPTHDRTRHQAAGLSYCWCPACATEAETLTTYIVNGQDWHWGAFSQYGQATAVAIQLAPCGHIVDQIVLAASADGYPVNPRTN